MELSFPFERVYEFFVFFLVFVLGQVAVEMVRSLFFRPESPVVYHPCPAMEKEHVEKFLELFSRQTSSQESILAMLRHIAQRVDEEGNKIEKKLNERDEPFQMIRDMHKKIIHP